MKKVFMTVVLIVFVSAVAYVSYGDLGPKIKIDGRADDWEGIQANVITLRQQDPVAGYTFIGKVDPIPAKYKVYADSKYIYILFTVAERFLYDPEKRKQSPAIAVLFRMDEGAGPAMGASVHDMDKSLGRTDMWVWELGCGPGELSGGGVSRNLGRDLGGKDEKCDFDDMMALKPRARGFDRGDKSENSLVGAWDHTGRVNGVGAEGEWVFEMKRPLVTKDDNDIQLAPGEDIYIGFAYWSPAELKSGWTGAGHLQTASEYGWLKAKLPGGGGR